MNDYNIPYGYSVLSYIESTGTQYIDTGFIPKQTTRIVIDAVCTNSNTGFVFGTRTDAWTNTYCLVNLSGVLRNDFGTTQVNTGFSATSRFTFDLNKRALSINNSSSSYSSTHTSQTFTCPSNLTLFACNTNGVIETHASVRFYSCQIYNNGTLVRDFIPVMDSNGVYGLYDQVGAAFYKNQGSGKFVAGEVLYTKPESNITEEVSYENIPSGYSVVSYLKSTGTQYIDTGFKPNQDTRVVIKLECPVGTSTNWCFGARTSSTADRYTFGASSSGYYASAYKTTAGNMDAYHNTEKPFELDKNKNNTYIKGAIVASATYEEFSASVPLALFAINTNGSFTKGKLNIYSCKIYDNDVLVRDYIPVINDIGQYGLYDLVNRQFYKNSGTGTFGIGKILYIKPNVIGSGSELNSSIYQTLPNNYLPIQYIENNEGYAYIDTGVYGTQNTSILADVHVVDFITHTYCPMIGFYSSTNSLTINPGTGSTTSRRGTITLSNAFKIDENTRNVFENLVSNTKLNGSFTGTWSSVTEFVTSGTLWVGQCNGSSARAYTKIYECIIWEGEEKIRHFIPCINPEGIVGMYDIVNEQFYGSASSYSFTAGPNIPVIKKVFSSFRKRLIDDNININHSLSASKYVVVENIDTIPTLITTQTLDVEGNIQYSYDQINWIQQGDSESIEVPSKACVYLKGDLVPNNLATTQILITEGLCRLYGNCMALLFMDDAVNQQDLSQYPYAFSGLFKNGIAITYVSSNFLPATTLSSHCYEKMFQGCTNLKQVPNLPASVLTEYCYSYMFSETGIINPPIVPEVTTWGNYSCEYMFYKCTSLIAIAAFNYAKLETYSCSHMYDTCKSLTSVTLTKMTQAKDHCCEYMFYNCTGLTYCYLYNHSSAGYYTYQYMFYGCSKLITADVDLSVVVQKYICNHMFTNCTKLTSIGKYNLTNSSGQPTYSPLSFMFYNCTSLTSIPSTAGFGFTYNSSMPFDQDICTSMFRGCTKLVSVYCTIPFIDQTIFQSCTSLKEVTSIGGLDLYKERAFENCTSLTELPPYFASGARSLQAYMFKGCTRLKDVSSITKLICTSQIMDDLCWGCFENCTSLRKGPLTIGTNSSGSYNYSGGLGIFKGCTNLTQSPEILDGTVGTSSSSQAFHETFRRCSNLKYIKCLVKNPYNNTENFKYWVSDVPSTGVFIKDPEATWNTGTNGIPTGWVVVDNGTVETVEIFRSEETPYNNNNEYPSHRIVFEQGMTWKEWVNSKYNVFGYTISGNSLTVKNYPSTNSYTYYLDNVLNDVISASTVYREHYIF